jgi:hypothetical protein
MASKTEKTMAQRLALPQPVHKRAVPHPMDQATPCAPAFATCPKCGDCGEDFKPGAMHYCPDPRVEVVFDGGEAVTMRVWSRETQSWWEAPFIKAKAANG